ncbi:hypothetical protein HDV03_002937 [Kappamyces sp. JEL0829]|nr:hypothetical protein HDV03_002937 [Kappamyces sp. JEL0829]
MSLSSKVIKLNNGHRIPALGLGTWRAEKGVVAEAVKTALAVGYKHIDCAYIYENEAEIGQVFGQKGFNRHDVFVTSKLWNNRHNDVEAGLNRSLKDLQLEYLDLYLVHWPCTYNPTTKKHFMDKNQIKSTWQQMERMVDVGKTKSIGVSNFTIELLQDILSYARIKPAVVQVELHPYLPQNDLLEFCNQHEIALTAYSPLGSLPGPESVLNDPEVAMIAQRHGKSPAQVLISWALQRGTAVIPKSSKPERIKSNYDTFELTEDDMKTLARLGQTHPKRYVDPAEYFDVDVFGLHKLEA